MNSQIKLLLALVLLIGVGFTAYTLMGTDPVVIVNEPNENPGPDSGSATQPPELTTQNPGEIRSDNGKETKRTRIDGPNIDSTECEQGIVGRLVNPQGGPVADAVVYLLPAMTGVDTMRMIQQYQQGVMFPPVAKSNSRADGSFTLGLRHWKEENKYEVRIVHPNFCDNRLPNIAPQPKDWWDCGKITLKNGVTVFGQVTTETGLPVINANVSVNDGSGMMNIAPTPGREAGLSSKTDNSGSYEIRNIDPVGVHALSAVAENFAKDEKNEIQLTGSTRHRIDFKLSPGLDIAGTVVNPKGEPVAGASITISALSQKSRLMEKTATDDDGYFIVSGIKAGPYAVMVDAQGYLKIDEKPIQAGEKDLEFTLESQGRVYITVIDKNNRPLPNYHVNLKAAFEGQDRYGNAIVKKPVRGAKDGTVLVAGVNPMTYVAEIYASGHAKKFSERFTITEAQTEPPRITVNLDSGGTIAGVVTDLKGKPISGITVITRPDGMIDNPFLQIFQVPYTITKRSGKTNKNGQFRFELMNPGKYQLKLSSKDYCAVYVQGIEVAIGQVAESNDIQMTRGCSISGITKVNGQPTGQVKVNISAVRSKDSPTPFSAEAISDNEGRFLLNKRLKPGKYEVMAAEQVQANPLLMMVQFSKSKQEIVIPQGSDHREIDVNISK